MKALFFAIILLATALFHPLAKADRVRLLKLDEEALQARTDLLFQAKSEILAEYFSVWNDDQSIGALSILLKKAQSGVKVKVIMDALANSVPSALLAALLEQGKDAAGNQNLEIKVYNAFTPRSPVSSMTHRDHAKMLIADREIGESRRLILGGRNIGDKYFGFNKSSNYRDLDAITEGSLAEAARKSFFEVWRSNFVSVPDITRFSAEQRSEESCENVEEETPSDCAFKRRSAARSFEFQSKRLQTIYQSILNKGQNIHVKANEKTDWLIGIQDFSDVQFLSQNEKSLATKETNNMTRDLLQLAAKAKHSIDILTPYLVANEKMKRAFQYLIEKNHINIRVVTNSLASTDNLFAHAGYQDSKNDLIRIGIELSEYLGPDTAHAKAALLDDDTVFIGTFNLDPRSSYLNREVGIVVKGPSDDGRSETTTNQLVRDIRSAIEAKNGFRASSLLVGKDGMPQNLDLQKNLNKKIDFSRKIQLKLLKPFLFLYKDQL